MNNLINLINETFIGKRVVIRSNSAGVFVGTLVARDGQTVLLKNSRRIWGWEGAASLSELSQLGVKADRKSACKFPIPMAEQVVEEVIEIIPATKEALNSLDSTPIWGFVNTDYTITEDGTAVANS